MQEEDQIKLLIILSILSFNFDNYVTQARRSCLVVSVHRTIFFKENPSARERHNKVINIVESMVTWTTDAAEVREIWFTYNLESMHEQII